MRLSESNLRLLIRKTLRSSMLNEGINSHINSLLETLYKAVPDFKIVLCKKKQLGKDARLEIIDPNLKRRNVLGFVEFSKASAKIRTNCSGAYVVDWTKRTSDFKIGPLVYDILIELLSLVGSGLTSDKEEVSHPVLDFSDKGYAHHMWLFYLHNRPDLKKIKLDPTPFKFTKDTTDDCVGQSSFINWMYDQNSEYAKVAGKSGYPSKKSRTSLTTNRLSMKKLNAGDPKDFEDYSSSHSSLKRIPKKYQDSYKTAWENNELPLMIMVQKTSSPLLQKLRNMGKTIELSDKITPTCTLLFNAYSGLGSIQSTKSQKIIKSKKSDLPDWDPQTEWDQYQSASSYKRSRISRRWRDAGYSRAGHRWSLDDLR